MFGYGHLIAARPEHTSQSPCVIQARHSPPHEHSHPRGLDTSTVPGRLCKETEAQVGNLPSSQSRQALN